MTPTPRLAWRYPTPLQPAKLVKRYKCFLADVERPNGDVITVHCANPGAMTSCSEPGRPVRIRDSESSTRKLRFDLEQIRMAQAWVGIHTNRANAVVASLLAQHAIEGIANYTSIASEVPCGEKRRIDFRLNGGDRPCWVEVKTTTMRRGHDACFPDAVTKRGLAHIETLMDRVREGDDAILLYYVTRADVRAFRPADWVDPAYAEALVRAVRVGVRVVAVRAAISEHGLGMRDCLPTHVGP